MSRSRRRGSVAIEAAITLPVLLTTFIGVMEMSRLISMEHRVARAARDGARVGSVTIEGPDADGDEIEAAAVAQAQTVLDASDVGCGSGCTITADWEESDGDMWVTVNVVVPYQPFTHMFPTLRDGISTEFTMMTQQQ